MAVPRSSMTNPFRRTATIATPFAAALIALVSMPAQHSDACTRVLWNDNDLAVIVGRTMDWPESTEPILTVFPRGMKRDGGRLGTDVVVRKNAVKWTSKYGSLVTQTYGAGSADGINERGLGVHMLYLKATDFGPRNKKTPGLHAGLWAQFLLDNAATVEEAVALNDSIQLVMTELRGHKATVHLAIEDATGDSAIIEYVAGKARVHRGREYQIMTNDPPYDEQLALLAAQDYSKPSRELPLPGNVNAVDRFQRAAYFKAVLPEPKVEREAVAGMFAIMRNVSVPFGAPYGEFGIYNTEYRTVMNLTRRRYYFELSTSPSVIWADLSRMNLEPGAPVMVLDPQDPNLCGDVTNKFEKAARAPF